MATSFTVNLGIQSVLGFKRPSGSVEAPRPIMQTTRTLNGVEFADLGMTEQTRVLIVDPVSPYTIRYESTSSPQQIVLRNYGNSTLTVFTTATQLYSLLAGTDGVDPVFYFTPTEVSTGRLEIAAESSATFGLAYYGRQLGTWSNTVLLVTDIDTTYYKINTSQTVSNIYDFDILPPASTSTVSVYARSYTTSFTIDPYQGVTETLTATVTGTGYAIVGSNTTTVEVSFDPSLVGNALGSYIGEITVTANSVVHSATVTSIISLTPGAYQNYGAWLSPVSYYNSVIGFSYDSIDNQRTLTIGVGTGGTDVADYARGGAPFADITGLGISGSELDPTYPYWANVYRIPVNASGDTTPRSYESKNYLVKQVNEDLEYGSYFGDYASQGSMFIVHDDGYGNIRVEMNRLRELSDDEDLNITLSNLSRAFYYYSGVDLISTGITSFTVDSSAVETDVTYNDSLLATVSIYNGIYSTSTSVTVSEGPGNKALLTFGDIVPAYSEITWKVYSRYPANDIGNLELLPFTPGIEYTIDGTLTRMFLGFLRSGEVITSIVDKPVAD